MNLELTRRKFNTVTAAAALLGLVLPGCKKSNDNSLSPVKPPMTQPEFDALLTTLPKYQMPVIHSKFFPGKPVVVIVGEMHTFKDFVTQKLGEIIKDGAFPGNFLGVEMCSGNPSDRHNIETGLKYAEITGGTYTRQQKEDFFSDPQKFMETTGVGHFHNFSKQHGRDSIVGLEEDPQILAKAHLYTNITTLTQIALKSQNRREIDFLTKGVKSLYEELKKVCPKENIPDFPQSHDPVSYQVFEQEMQHWYSRTEFTNRNTGMVDTLDRTLKQRGANHAFIEVGMAHLLNTAPYSEVSAISIQAALERKEIGYVILGAVQDYTPWWKSSNHADIAPLIRDVR